MSGKVKPFAYERDRFGTKFFNMCKAKNCIIFALQTRFPQVSDRTRIYFMHSQNGLFALFPIGYNVFF